MEKALKTVVAAAFIVMIAVNALANILPFNNLTTGQVSDAYPNLFAPAPLTFGIWAIIYLLLALHILYLLGLAGGPRDVSKKLLARTGVLFAASSLLNAGWMFAWHYRLIPLSMGLMAAILICLAAITQMYRHAGLGRKENLFLLLPFSVYFGWITIATIANATALLVSLQWDGFGILPQTWTAVVLAVGLIIGGTVILRQKDAAYGLVLIWAYAGILIKHVSAGGFQGAYPAVYLTVIACVALLAAATGIAAFGKGKRKAPAR